MEGQEGLTKKQVCVIVVVLFHAVGLAGFLWPAYRPLFIYLVPYHLLLMAMVLFYSYGRVSIRLSGFFLLVYTLGYSCEWIGVHTNWLFGDYTYGNTLGHKLMDVPLLIGVNWFLLVFSAGALLQKTKIRNRLARVLTGAVLLTALDILIEPVAVRFNYWQWAGYHAPLKNYICWFLLGVIMLWLFELFRFKRLGYAAPVFLICQFVFFCLLNMV